MAYSAFSGREELQLHWSAWRLLFMVVLLSIGSNLGLSADFRRQGASWEVPWINREVSRYLGPDPDAAF